MAYIIETLAKPGRGNVLVAHTTAENRGDRPREIPERGKKMDAKMKEELLKLSLAMRKARQTEQKEEKKSPSSSNQPQPEK